MNDRYLWDRSGPPDPEVERLEELLAPLAHRPAGRPGLAVVPRRAKLWPALAAAAVLLLAAASLLRFEIEPGAVTGWQIA